MAELLIHNTHGNDDVERASLALVVANTALNSGQDASLLLTIDGVWIATQGYAQGLQADGFAPLADLLNQFIENGGHLLVCGACMKPRSLTAEHLLPGAQLVGAAYAVEMLSRGITGLSF